MTTVTVEKPPSFGPVGPAERPVPPVVVGSVFGKIPSHQVGGYARRRFVDDDTLRILSAGTGVLGHREVSVLGRRSSNIGVRYPVGGGGGSRENSGKGSGEREKQCATPGCGNPCRTGDNYCASCRASIDRERAKSRNTLSNNGTRQVPSAHRRHGR